MRWPTDAERLEAIDETMEEMVDAASRIYHPQERQRKEARLLVKADRAWIINEVRDIVARGQIGEEGARRVGCEDHDGLLHVHSEGESCAVCQRRVMAAACATERFTTEDLERGVIQRTMEAAIDVVEAMQQQGLTSHPSVFFAIEELESLLDVYRHGTTDQTKPEHQTVAAKELGSLDGCENPTTVDDVGQMCGECRPCLDYIASYWYTVANDMGREIERLRRIVTGTAAAGRAERAVGDLLYLAGHPGTDDGLRPHLTAVADAIEERLSWMPDGAE